MSHSLFLDQSATAGEKDAEELAAQPWVLEIVPKKGDHNEPDRHPRRVHVPTLL